MVKSLENGLLGWVTKMSHHPSGKGLFFSLDLAVESKTYLDELNPSWTWNQWILRVILPERFWPFDQPIESYL